LIKVQKPRTHTKNHGYTIERERESSLTCQTVFFLEQVTNLTSLNWFGNVYLSVSWPSEEPSSSATGRVSCRVRERDTHTLTQVSCATHTHTRSHTPASSIIQKHQRFRSIRTGTRRFKNCFYPQAVHLLNCSLLNYWTFWTIIGLLDYYWTYNYTKNSTGAT